MSYTTSRIRERFTYKRVSWADFGSEVADYGQFTGGTISRGAYTTLKTSAQLTFTGTPPDTTDLVRVYYSFADEAGVDHSDCLGTFLVGLGSTSYIQNGEGLVATGTITGYSTLKVLSDRLCGLPLTIAAGTDPITAAVSLIQGCGLAVNYPTGTSYALTNAHTFEPDDSYLTVVNWLLTNCSTPFQAVYPDVYGVVQVQPYQDPTSRAAVWTFADGIDSIMLPNVAEENAWQDNANVTRLYYEDETVAMWASASNDSGSRSSLDLRGGRETTYFERVDEIADLTALEALAVTRLKDRASEIEHVTLQHAYAPIGAGDPVAVRYGGSTWSGTVQNMDMNLAPGLMCTTQLRRYVSAALTVTVDGAEIWRAS